jgi:ATP-dependent DNA ligase
LRHSPRGIQLPEHLAATDGKTIFRHACVMGLAGIVAKRRDRSYRSGRSPDWTKVKNPGGPAVTRAIRQSCTGRRHWGAAGEASLFLPSA